jgi:phospholipid transport system substrate-binding protein
MAVVLALGTPGRAADGPRQVIQALTTAALEVLGATDLSAREKRDRLQTLVYRYVDFDTLSHLVLAQSWSRFTPAQQQEFVDEFKAHLALTYGKSIENYGNERVEVRSDREEARGDWTVKSTIVRGGSDDVAVDYRLRKNAQGDWKIIDFIIEGVSLVVNYRSQFQSMLGNGSPESLLVTLRDKNARGETLKAPGARPVR